MWPEWQCQLGAWLRGRPLAVHQIPIFFIGTGVELALAAQVDCISHLPCNMAHQVSKFSPLASEQKWCPLLPGLAHKPVPLAHLSSSSSCWVEWGPAQQRKSLAEDRRASLRLGPWLMVGGWSPARLEPLHAVTWEKKKLPAKPLRCCAVS